MSNSGFKQTLLALICLITVSGNLSAQGKVIDLWYGKVPGAIANNNFKQTVDSADNWIKMRFVTEPKLDMYPVPEEKATGTAVRLFRWTRASPIGDRGRACWVSIHPPGWSTIFPMSCK